MSVLAILIMWWGIAGSWGQEEGGWMDALAMNIYLRSIHQVLGMQEEK
jgi:hypothetical protein